MSEYGSTPPPPPGGGSGGYAAPPPSGPAGGPPDNKLVWSILVTLFCCLPFGIVAIIKSAEVNSKWGTGDYAGAQQSAADAGKWIKWSVIVGVAASVIGVVLWFALFASIMASSSSSGY